MVHVILLAAGLFYFFLSRLADCYLARARGLPLTLANIEGGDTTSGERPTDNLAQSWSTAVDWLGAFRRGLGKRFNWCREVCWLCQDLGLGWMCPKVAIAVIAGLESLYDAPKWPILC